MLTKPVCFKHFSLYNIFTEDRQIYFQQHVTIIDFLNLESLNKFMAKYSLVILHLHYSLEC